MPGSAHSRLGRGGRYALCQPGRGQGRASAVHRPAGDLLPANCFSDGKALGCRRPGRCSGRIRCADAGARRSIGHPHDTKDQGNAALAYRSAIRAKRLLRFEKGFPFRRKAFNSLCIIVPESYRQYRIYSGIVTYWIVCTTNKCVVRRNNFVLSHLNLKRLRVPLSIIVDALATQYGADRSYLFGSYAGGDADKDSDIDLRIDKGAIIYLI
ncbi:MAG TPA: hypothetical protein DDY90_04095, partial [Clostridiales bacterium]|nr:hypothetical protein [Clostridiales bacterium]